MAIAFLSLAMVLAMSPVLAAADGDPPEKCLISFKNSDGLVVQTREVALGDTFAGPSGAVLDSLVLPPGPNQRLLHWYE